MVSQFDYSFPFLMFPFQLRENGKLSEGHFVIILEQHCGHFKFWKVTKDSLKDDAMVHVVALRPLFKVIRTFLAVCRWPQEITACLRPWMVLRWTRTKNRCRCSRPSARPPQRLSQRLPNLWRNWLKKPPLPPRVSLIIVSVDSGLRKKIINEILKVI